MILEGKEACSRYLPQRAPMLMVDRLESCSASGCVTGLSVEADNLLAEAGCLSDGGLLEHCAQSAALHMGYNRVSQGLPVVVGFIGSLDKFTVSRLPRVGETLRTAITVEAEAGPVTLLGATVCVGSETIAQGKLKVALQL